MAIIAVSVIFIGAVLSPPIVSYFQWQAYMKVSGKEISYIDFILVHPQIRNVE